MNIAHNVRITVFVKEEDNMEEIVLGLKKLIPLNLEEEKIQINETVATSFNDKKIRIFEITLEKQRQIKEFVEFLKEKMSEATKALVLQQLDSRIDNECRFYLRFDKEKWIKEENLWLTDAGNCFHVKFSVAAYPTKKECAIEVIRNIFKEEKQA